MTRNEASSITVTVLLFAAYREALGQQRLALSVAAGTSAGDLFDLLARDASSLAALRRYTTFAVNREVCLPATLLANGDEVAFLQPASGGAHD